MKNNSCFFLIQKNAFDIVIEEDFSDKYSLTKEQLFRLWFAAEENGRTLTPYGKHDREGARHDFERYFEEFIK